jgi:heat-inducible transcriptional repressor
MLISDNERLILRLIVHYFILKACPISSNYLVKNSNLSYSSASIRNIMAKLEEKGYIHQPHTSAGRVPTTLGYRFYVDNMLPIGRVSADQKESIKKVYFQNAGDFEAVLREASRILSQLSSQLGVIISPQLDEGVFHRMDLTRLNSDRLLLVLLLKTGMVKAIYLQVNSNLKDEYLDSLRNILNERLFGLKLKEIRSNFSDIMKDIQEDEEGLISLFIKAADKIFDFSDDNEVYLNGTYNMLRQSEFMDKLEISGVVELLENKKVIIHLFDEESSKGEIKIRIGEEININGMKNFSIISAKYNVNEMVGTLGVIGPMRMDYSHIIPLVNYTANFLSNSFDSN